MGVIMTRLFVVFFAVFAALPVHAQVYKCTENGKTVFSDVPCADGEELNVKPLKRARKSDRDWVQEYQERSKKESEEREKQQREKELADIELQQKFKVIEDAKLAEIRKSMPDPSMECNLSGQDIEALESLNKLFRRYRETAEVAQNTPVSSIGPALLKLSDIKHDIEDIEVTADCAKNIRKNAMIFTEITQKGMNYLSAQNKTDAFSLFFDAARIGTQYDQGREMFLTK